MADRYLPPERMTFSYGDDGKPVLNERRPAWVCFACGHESFDLAAHDFPCPDCSRAPGWTTRPREARRAVRLHRLRVAGRLTPAECAALMRKVTTVWAFPRSTGDGNAAVQVEHGATEAIESAEDG